VVIDVFSPTLRAASQSRLCFLSMLNPISFANCERLFVLTMKENPSFLLK